MSIDFDSKATYGDDDKYIKTKINTYEDSITTIFYNKKGSKKIPEEKIPRKCLSIIILDSALHAYRKYHPQTFLEVCKYALEKVKTKNYIDEELKSESDTNNGEKIWKKCKSYSDNDESIFKKYFNTTKSGSVC